MSQNKYQPSVNGVKPTVTSTTEIILATRQRTFKGSDKFRILAAPAPGRAILVSLAEMAAGTGRRITGRTEPKKRGRKADAQSQELLTLRQENQRLQTCLHQAELIIDAKKKLAQTLEEVAMVNPSETSKWTPSNNSANKQDEADEATCRLFD